MKEVVSFLELILPTYFESNNVLKITGIFILFYVNNSLFSFFEGNPMLCFLGKSWASKNSFKETHLSKNKNKKRSEFLLEGALL